MREHTYTVAKGNEVRAEFVGQTVTFQRATTIKEALDNFYENEEALVAAAEQQRLIAIREKCRTVLGTPEGTIAAAAEAGNKVKLGAPRERAEPKPRTPKGEADRASKDTGNRLYEKMRGDEKFRAQMLRNGVADEEGFNKWLAVHPAVAEAATA